MSKNEMSDTLQRAREFFNASDLENYITTLYAEDVHFSYFPPQLPPGRAGAHVYYTTFLAGFPDTMLFLDDVIAENDRLAVRYHIEATHLGDFNGIPASGKSITMSGISILQFQHGQVIERWDNSDQLALLQQIGALPQPG